MTRNEAIETNLSLVAFVLNKYLRQYVGTDTEADLFQAGCIGLIEAVDRFDENKNAAFSTYAAACIYGEMRRYLKTKHRLIRIASQAYDAFSKASEQEKQEFLTKYSPRYLSDICTDMGHTLEEMLMDERESVEDEVICSCIIDQIMSDYTERNRHIIHLLLEGYNTREVAKIFEVSPTTIQNIYRIFKNAVNEHYGRVKKPVKPQRGSYAYYQMMNREEV